MQQDNAIKENTNNYLLTVLLSILLICLATWGVYYSSLYVPFYLDDVGSITNNPKFEGADVTSLFHDYGLRYLGYVGLWLNYEYAKLDVFSYHVVNVTIHMLTGIAVFFLTLKLTQLSKVVESSKHQLVLACIVALLFICHPLQSQGVTYIVQRLASQTALFYIASLASYLYCRTALSKQAQFLFALMSCAFAVCAVLTKQNAFTLPLVILMTEWVVFDSIKRKQTLGIASLTLLGVILASVFLGGVTQLLSTLDSLTRETGEITRLEYFLAQQPILWEYIAKVFWPWPLQLEYDLTIHSFPSWLVGISALGHLLLLTGAIVFRRKLAIISWGVMFYYIAHLVESSVIPIRDIVFEHRTYLPNIGIFISVSFFVYLAFRDWANRSRVTKSIATLTPIAVLISLALLTISRNQQWQNPEVFFAHDLSMAPSQPRAIHNYAEYKLKTGNVNEAIALLETLFELNTDKIDGIMLNTYLAALIATKQYENALERAHSILELPVSVKARSIINSNIGVIYTNLKRYSDAIPYFKKAYSQGIVPSNSLIAFAYSSFVLGDYALAEKLCKEILIREPQHERAKLLLTMMKR